MRTEESCRSHPWGDQSLRPHHTRSDPKSSFSVSCLLCFPFVMFLWGTGELSQHFSCWGRAWAASWSAELGGIFSETMEIVTENQGGKNFCLRDPDFTKGLAGEELLE